MRTTAFVFLALISASAGAQQATELFIPLGASPNLSDEVTVIGTLSSVEAEKRTITVKTEAGSATAIITEKTKIFLDRSRLKEPNRYGAFADLVEGARVEVLYQGRTRATAGPAEWVKVEVTR